MLTDVCLDISLGTLLEGERYCMSKRVRLLICSEHSQALSLPQPAWTCELFCRTIVWQPRPDAGDVQRLLLFPGRLDPEELRGTSTSRHFRAFEKPSFGSGVSLGCFNNVLDLSFYTSSC